MIENKRVRIRTLISQSVIELKLNRSYQSKKIINRLLKGSSTLFYLKTRAVIAWNNFTGFSHGVFCCYGFGESVFWQFM